MIHPSTCAVLFMTMALSSVSACSELPQKAPPLAKMTLARPPEKLSPPVDVRYLVTTSALAGGDTEVAIAVVPRVAGSNLRVSFASQGMQIAAAGQEITAQSVSAASPYRRSLAVKAGPDSAAAVQVLVSIDVGESSFFGVYQLPLDQSPPHKSHPAESSR